MAAHQEAAREWTTRQGVTSASVVDSAFASAALIEVDHPCGQNGDWYSADVHYIDMCLTPRRPRSRACFVASSNEYHTAGRLFLAPAGRCIRFQGSPGRQQNLALFLSASAADGEVDDLSTADEALWQCLNIWSESIRTPLRRIAEELRHPDFASGRIIEGLSLVILGELSRLLRQPRPKLGASGGLATWRLNLIEEMVRSEQPPPSVVELAAACRMSARHLMRAFRSETGQSSAPTSAPRPWSGPSACCATAGSLSPPSPPKSASRRRPAFPPPSGGTPGRPRGTSERWRKQNETPQPLF